MPITASVLKTLQKHVTFDYLGETVNIAYFPSALGDDALKAGTAIQNEMIAAQASQDESAIDALMLKTGAYIAAFLASWDFMQDDGVTPQPITAENLAAQLVAFPDFIQTVIGAIMVDRNQGNAPAPSAPANSGAISSPTEPLVTSAESPTPSESSLPQDGSTEPQQ